MWSDRASNGNCEPEPEPAATVWGQEKRWMKTETEVDQQQRSQMGDKEERETKI